MRVHRYEGSEKGYHVWSSVAFALLIEKEGSQSMRV